jgi:hypothetical protein
VRWSRCSICTVKHSVIRTDLFELRWVRVGNTFVAVLYHPPAPVYKQRDLLDYVEACVAEMGRDFPAVSIVLAGDLNQLTDQDLQGGADGIDADRSSADSRQQPTRPSLRLRPTAV